MYRNAHYDQKHEATELCITKGQEGLVSGWESSTGSHGKPILDTLYVKLISPPKNIQVPHLPPNVVPIPRSSTYVTCLMDDGGKIGVRRQQVLVLPNFAMTDYASQGKTRPLNVVDLTHCKNHQSCYTALSRSSSAAGTIIVQGFSTHKITKGISGFLRQEFRELEMLNTITKLHYEEKLPSIVNGALRNQLIRSYQLWVTLEKGMTQENITEQWHPAIKWDKNEDMIKNIEQDGTWDLQLNSDAVVYGIKEMKKLKASQKRSRETSEHEITNSSKQNDQIVTNKKKKCGQYVIWYSCSCRSQMGQYKLQLCL